MLFRIIHLPPFCAPLNLAPQQQGLGCGEWPQSWQGPARGGMERAGAPRVGAHSVGDDLARPSDE